MKRDKLLKEKRKYLLLIIIGFIGLICGIIFMFVINKTDKELFFSEINKYFISIKDNKFNSLDTFINCFKSNTIELFIVWLLGISVIGLPFIIFFFLFKSFSLSFSVAGIIAKYRFRGVFLSFMYIFPSALLNLLIWLFLVYYSLSFSIRLISVFIFKKNINIKASFNRYLKIFILCFIGLIISGLLESFLTPNLIKLVIK